MLLFIRKERLYRFTKPQLLNLPNFQSDQLLSSCLGFDLNLLSNENGGSSLILDTKQNANLQQVDVAFFTLIYYFRKLLYSYFGGYFQICIS